jgi:hypothetical protein
MKRAGNDHHARPGFHRRAGALANDDIVVTEILSGQQGQAAERIAELKRQEDRGI